jgi:hypothetical protein
MRAARATKRRQKLAVHVREPHCPCPFVQIINILCDDQQIGFPFPVQPRKRHMGVVGHHFGKTCTPLIVETMHQRRIPRQRLGRAHIFNPVSFPQAARSAKGSDPAFGGNSSPCQDHNILESRHQSGLFCSIFVAQSLISSLIWIAF